MAKCHVRRFLKALPQLRELCIKFNGSGQDIQEGSRAIYEPHAQLSHIVEPGYVWPALETLTLSHIGSLAAELTSVINSHPSLTFVHLTAVGILDPNFDEFSDFRASIKPGNRVLLDNLTSDTKRYSLPWLVWYRESSGDWRELSRIWPWAPPDEGEERGEYERNGANNLELERRFADTW
ncbi:hypothetical protein B0T14DRAFT_563259 [Immersiella caudata]|uniref:Uncharacterized protein n=1 Tax=Immersiella caudata TaxID=314043 RepID=A0AA39X533_9PEZI|nr:hypothetical protein B0T14DRAFT_563259 [Immersiella caudata]